MTLSSLQATLRASWVTAKCVQERKPSRTERRQARELRGSKRPALALDSATTTTQETN
jgi:hypothetical protein